MPEAIHWLHLSDLHFGQNSGDWGERICAEFCVALPAILRDRDLPYPEIIFVTGDLAFSGKFSQYHVYDKFIDKIKGCHPDWNPTVLSVPGNHDYDRKNAYSSSPFSAYMQNCCKRHCACSENCNFRLQETCPTRCNKRRLNIACSGFFGDYYYKLDLPGKFPLAVLGLNTNLLLDHMDGQNGAFTRIRQLHMSVQEAGLNPKINRKILLFHHPPSELNSREKVFKDIDTFFGNIDICLHGHQHRSQSTIRTICNGKEEYQYQVASLCGLEKYGTPSENRSFGFAIGCISKYGEIRVWPFVRELVHGEESFVWDRRLGEEYHIKGTDRKAPGILIRKANLPDIDFKQLAQESREITFTGLFKESLFFKDPLDKKKDLLDNLSDIGRDRMPNTEWDLTFVLPDNESLSGYSSLLNVDKSYWEQFIRKIRDFLQLHPEIKGKYLEHRGVCPLEAVLFDNQILAYRILGMPGEHILRSDWNDESFRQFADMLSHVREKASPITEFNIFGHIDKGQFNYEGIVPHLMWRGFTPAIHKIYPVSICLIVHNDRIVLQNRSERNSGCDIGKASLIAEKLIESDFFDEDPNQYLEFWNLAAKLWQAGASDNSSLLAELSGQFKKNIGLENTGIIPPQMLARASRRAMRRCLCSELNLSVSDEDLQPAQEGYHRIIQKDEISIYVSLYKLKISDDQYNACSLHDGDIREVEIKELDRTKPKLNAFISKNLDSIKQMVHLMQKTGTN